MSGADQLTTYGELAEVIDSLGLIVRERRRQRRLSVRAAAAEIGISFSTVSRLESIEGHLVDGKNLAAVLRWLDAPQRPEDTREETGESDVRRFAADVARLVREYAHEERGVIALTPFEATLDQLCLEKYGFDLDKVMASETTPDAPTGGED